MHLSSVTTLLSALAVSCFCGVAACPSIARAESWKPAFHDADELYDAAEDLRDRAQKLRDPRVMPVTEALEEMTAQLYHQLKHNACSADVVPLLNATGAVLNEATALVTLSCEMRGDRKSLSELENARRYFAATSHHIHCALHPHAAGVAMPAPYTPMPYLQAPHAPVPDLRAPERIPPGAQAPLPYPQAYPQSSGQPFGRGLPRVMITQALTR